MILELQKRILANKVAKGFPIKDLMFDLRKLHEEINEFRDAYAHNDRKEMGDELADMVKIEKRKITQIGPDLFTKEEGV